jgi:epoxyqueuosine reductase
MTLHKSLFQSSRIREEAMRLGFFKTGIAAAGPPPYEKYFTTWLHKGFQGGMRYLERQASKRRDPGAVLPNAKSIIVTALNYYSKGTPGGEAPMRGRISRYARGDDYHGIILNRLERLLTFIKDREPSAHGLCYVDTGPIMEKVWGSQTTLGWIGKHTNLITREKGSWFFIGVILLNIPLDYDSPEANHCGTCDRCIRVCPTAAIVAPYTLDARRCISYLTIELRGPIPRSMRPLIGRRIFGCDDCQQVCPWNRFAVETNEKSLMPREESFAPELVSLIRITPEGFQRRYENSPIWRATRDGFVRNIAIALGNSHRADAIPALEDALRDDSPQVRGASVWALGRISVAETSRILERARAGERDPSVLDEFHSVLDV